MRNCRSGKCPIIAICSKTSRYGTNRGHLASWCRKSTLKEIVPSIIHVVINLSTFELSNGFDNRNDRLAIFCLGLTLNGHYVKGLIWISYLHMIFTYTPFAGHQRSIPPQTDFANWPDDNRLGFSMQMINYNIKSSPKEGSTNLLFFELTIQKAFL